LFGIYENFPDTYHGVAVFSHEGSTRKLQRIIIYSLYRLNNGKGVFPDVVPSNVEVTLEFGIADSITFNYLDREMLKHYRESFSNQTFPTLDFICIARYHVVEGEKRNPLKFDYYMLRFLFGESDVGLQVFHEKGTRRLSIEDLITCIVENINRGLARRNLALLGKKYLRAY